MHRSSQTQNLKNETNKQTKPTTNNKHETEKIWVQSLVPASLRKYKEKSKSWMYLQTSEQGVQGKDAHPVFSHILSLYPFYPPASHQTPIEGGMDETSLFFPSCYTFNWPKLDQILVPKIGKREDTQSIIPKVFPTNFPPSSLRCLLLGPYAWEIWGKKKKKTWEKWKKAPVHVNN